MPHWFFLGGGSAKRSPGFLRYMFADTVTVSASVDLGHGTAV